MIYEAYSPEDTENIASRFAQALKGGDVVCMSGDLGVGKTVFVRAVARALGIEEYISSPTFTVVNQYDDGKLPLYHFDAYRIADCDEMYDIGYEEYVYGDGVSVIEWSENIRDILPKERYEITISKDYDKGEEYRRIVIEKRGENGENIGG